MCLQIQYQYQRKGGGGAENAYSANGYTNAQPALRLTHGGSQLRHPQHEGNQGLVHKHSVNIYVYVFIYIHVREHVHTHMHVFFEWICAHTHTCAHPREHTTRTHTHAYTHTVSHVTHTRHTIVVGTSSEKREVDSLHYEK